MDIKVYLEDSLKKDLPAHIFLDRMRVIEEESRKSFAYNNNTYVPLYYWLGKVFKAKTLVEIGFRLGFLSGTYLKSCKETKYFLALQEAKVGEYYSYRLGRSNVRDNYRGYFFPYVGKCEDNVFLTKLMALEVDLAIINEEVGYDRHRLYYDMLWPQMKKDGLILVEYIKKYKPSAIAFKDFCISQNIKPIYINTSYGVGIIKKN